MASKFKHILAIIYLILTTFSALTSSIITYGDKKLNEWTWLVAHNSHVNWLDSSVISYASNQNMSIDQQLRYGVRGFMFDIDVKKCNDFEKLFNTCNCEGICLCHGECDGTGGGIKDGFAVKTLEYALRKVVKFLLKNRNEMVTLFLENYIKETKQLQDVFQRVKQFNSMVFNPYDDEWNVLKKGWPKIKDMMRANKRILIIDDEKRGKHAGKYPGFIRSRDFVLQNHYEWFHDEYEWNTTKHSSIKIPNFLLPPVANSSLTNNSTNLTNSSIITLEMSRCFSLHKQGKKPVWDERHPLNQTHVENNHSLSNGDKLFLFNHFYGVAAQVFKINPATVYLMNKREFVLTRLKEKCWPGLNAKRPNFIALDFINRDTYTDLIEPFNK